MEPTRIDFLTDMKFRLRQRRNEKGEMSNTRKFIAHLICISEEKDLLGHLTSMTCPCDFLLEQDCISNCAKCWEKALGAIK